MSNLDSHIGLFTYFQTIHLRTMLSFLNCSWRFQTLFQTQDVGTSTSQLATSVTGVISLLYHFVTLIYDLILIYSTVYPQCNYYIFQELSKDSYVLSLLRTIFNCSADVKSLKLLLVRINDCNDNNF